MVLDTLHIVEPTLNDQTGHCYSLVNSIYRAAAHCENPIELWAGKGAPTLFEETPGFRVHPYFHRSIRKFQAFFLYRRLLRQPGRICIPTVMRTDLIYFDLASRGPMPPSKLYVLFHWLKLTANKQRCLSRIARKHPEIVALAPTEGLRKSLVEQCGFTNARAVPYPITPVDHQTTVDCTPFRYLLFAGAAREDKGFSRVVKVIEGLSQQGKDMPVLLQTSPPHTGTHEPAIASAIERVQALNYPHLQTRSDTLDQAEYLTIFRGSVCLQLYDREDYADDRLSGVTLDALSCGSPVIATADTWMARTIERFDAGIAVDESSPEAVIAAAETIRDRFDYYRANAQKAGQALQSENDGGVLLRLIAGPAPTNP